MFASGDGTASANASCVFMASGDASIWCRLIEAPFPNWKRAIGDATEVGRLSYERDALLEAIDFAASQCEPQNAAVTILGQGNDIRIVARRWQGCSSAASNIGGASGTMEGPAIFDPALLSVGIRSVHDERGILQLHQYAARVETASGAFFISGMRTM
jgi:hypothetical protein